ncbi:hypothetical protein SANBI_000277 [Sanguibacter sp. 4.1]|uniref:Uncharacterized protein n=1 Tax=Sanguibacter biliveldensis TaxID=3030830 RepID=A0AAF1BYB5_9MICO|nr:hypothetical protein [Sanguibacter sp. 4.1]WPF82666.1 hypothetical protein SANBI_000277 [Sanguibacter sp. 4.1]
MPTNAFRGQGDYLVPVVPAGISGDLGAKPDDDKPSDVAEADIKEEVAVAENIESAESGSATLASVR